MSTAFLVVLGHVVAALGLGWLYFRRYTLARPPIGVIGLGDVVFMLVAIVLVPYLYLILPVWFVGVLLGLGVVSILTFALQPVLPRVLGWLVVAALVAADVWAARAAGPTSNTFFLVNNLVLVLGVVGATNLWAQSGMRARDAAILGAGLTLYDFLASAQSGLMNDLITRLGALPFAPLIAWNLATGRGLAVGLGDLLLATVFPIVMRKAFGRPAGLIALALGLAALAAMLLLLDLRIIRVTIPAMVVLGPLMVAQYLYWRRQRGPERRTVDYLAAEPLR